MDSCTSNLCYSKVNCNLMAFNLLYTYLEFYLINSCHLQNHLIFVLWYTKIYKIEQKKILSIDAMLPIMYSLLKISFSDMPTVPTATPIINFILPSSSKHLLCEVSFTIPMLYQDPIQVLSFALFIFICLPDLH